MVKIETGEGQLFCCNLALISICSMLLFEREIELVHIDTLKLYCLSDLNYDWLI